MKRLLSLAGIAVVVVAVAALAGVGRPEAARGDTPASPDTVTTNGHGVITVVPDSGTDQLEGIKGTMKIDIDAGKHSYELDYVLANFP